MLVAIFETASNLQERFDLSRRRWSFPKTRSSCEPQKWKHVALNLSPPFFFFSSQEEKWPALSRVEALPRRPTWSLERPWLCFFPTSTSHSCSHPDQKTPAPFPTTLQTRRPPPPQNKIVPFATPVVHPARLHPAVRALPALALLLARAPHGLGRSPRPPRLQGAVFTPYSTTRCWCQRHG